MKERIKYLEEQIINCEEIKEEMEYFDDPDIDRLMETMNSLKRELELIKKGEI